MNSQQSNTTTDAIAVALIHDKAQALRQQLTWLEDLEHDLQAVTQDEVKVTQPQPVNLREVVRQILLDSDGGRLRRRDIIERVRRQHPHVAPIGVVSTLAARQVFKKVDGDAFELRKNGRQNHDTQATSVPQAE